MTHTVFRISIWVMECTEAIFDEIYRLIGEQVAVIAKGMPEEERAKFAERKERIEALLKLIRCTIFVERSQ
jgi:GGDEF domain-containing protein